MNDNKDNKIKKTKKAKASIEKAIIKNMPLDEIQWIYQPLAITMMRADLSPMQISIIVEMMDKCQEKILEQIKKNEEDRKNNPSLFGEEYFQQGKYVIRFQLSDLDVRPDAYEEVYKASIALQAMQIKMPVVKPGGILHLDIFSLFSRISIPLLEKDYKYKNGKRRAGYIEMHMDKDTFEDVMRLGPQYTKYIKSVTRNRKCKYTPRIYMFISTFKVFGKWTIPFMDFHSMLGFSYEDEKMKEPVILNYKQFSDMKRSVLDPSQKELKKMAEAGTVDCYFDYEPIFPRGKTKGFPCKICFTIYTSDVGNKISVNNQLTSETIQIESFLKKELKQTPTNCQKLMKLLTEDNRAGFQQKMKTLKTYCEDPDHKVENTRSYAWQSLTDYLQAHQPVVEEITAATNEHSVGDLTGAKTNILTESKDLKIVIPMTEEEVKQWSVFLESIRNGIPEQSYNTWFDPIKFVLYKENTLSIQVPTIFFKEMLEDKFFEILRNSIFLAYGEGTKLMYKIHPVVSKK